MWIDRSETEDTESCSTGDGKAHGSPSSLRRIGARNTPQRNVTPAVGSPVAPWPRAADLTLRLPAGCFSKTFFFPSRGVGGWQSPSTINLKLELQKIAPGIPGERYMRGIQNELRRG